MSTPQTVLFAVVSAFMMAGCSLQAAQTSTQAPAANATVTMPSLVDDPNNLWLPQLEA